jgi:hypothetical protein
MSEINNSDLIRATLKALFTTAARRTTQNFAVAVIDSILRTLMEKYDFLKYVLIYPDYGSGEFIEINPEINKIHPARIGKVIEAIVQIVCLDLKEKAGHYFIKEVKINSGDEIISKLRDCGVDLDLLMLQQQYLYRRQNKENQKNVHDDGKIIDKQSLDNISLLGYSEETISSWQYDSNNKVCIIYDKDGKELDRLNLDTIIRGYVGTLTKEGNVIFSDDEKKEKGKKIVISKKEFELLKILYARDVDIKTATDILKVSEKELNYMVHKLLTLEMLHYSSTDEVALTETGINQLKTKNYNPTKMK